MSCCDIDGRVVRKMVDELRRRNDSLIVVERPTSGTGRVLAAISPRLTQSAQDEASEESKAEDYEKVLGG